MVPILDTVTLGRLAKAARMAQNMTRDDVYLSTGLSPAFISDVEAGKPTAQLGKVFHLLSELGVRLHGDAGDSAEALIGEIASGKKQRLRK